jgi:hypothetical protein
MHPLMSLSLESFVNGFLVPAVFGPLAVLLATVAVIRMVFR